MNDAIRPYIVALEIRRRIEDACRVGWAEAIGGVVHELRVSKVSSRLLILAARAARHGREWEAMTICQLAGVTYAETSDVLHGRRSRGLIDAAREADWEARTRALESLVRETTPASPGTR